MPPPTVPTTRGFFGSSFFSNGFFGSDFWKERVPVPSPVPTPPVGGGASWGGGAPKYHEPGMRRRCRLHKPNANILGVFAGKVAEKLTATITEDLKKNAHTDPMEALKKATTPDKVKEGMIRALRKRITALEENIRKLKGKNVEAVSELEGALADQAMEVEDLECVIERLETDLRVEQVRGAAYRAAHTRATELLAAYPEDVPAAGPGKLVIGALAYLAVEFLIPDRMVFLKDVGRVAAARVAISGLVDLIR